MVLVIQTLVGFCTGIVLLSGFAKECKLPTSSCFHWLNTFYWNDVVNLQLTISPEFCQLQMLLKHKKHLDSFILHFIGIFYLHVQKN